VRAITSTLEISLSSPNTTGLFAYMIVLGNQNKASRCISVEDTYVCLIMASLSRPIVKEDMASSAGGHDAECV
jgi:hypothetical protein